MKIIQYLISITVRVLPIFWAVTSFAVKAQAASGTSPASLTKIVNENFNQVAWLSGLKGPGAENLSPLDIFGFYFGLTVGFSGILFTVQVIHGGYLWMTAGGNDEQITKARKKITNGAIGLGIVLLAAIIVTFVLTQLAPYTGIVTGFSETTTPAP